MYMFKDNETDTEIIYVIAQFEKSKWWHYVYFPNVDAAKECLEKVRKKYTDIKFGLFEKIQKTTINMVDEGFISGGGIRWMKKIIATVIIMTIHMNTLII